MTQNDKNHSSESDIERIERWRWMLEKNVPVIGGWMHRRIASALIESALSGNWLAAQSLAVVVVYHHEAPVRRMAAQTLEKINYSTGIDAVWGVWAETRHPELDRIVTGYNRVANHPASVRLLSALRLEAYNNITHGSAELIPALIHAIDDRDAQIAARAQEVILRLHSQEAIDAVCSAWLDSRYPFLGEVLQQAGYVAERPPAVRVYSALKVNRLEVVMHSSPDMVPPLIEACNHKDSLIAQRARLCLPQLQKQAAIDEFCRLWSVSRSPLLEGILLQSGYKARSPIKVRLLVALKTGHLDIARKTPPQGLSVLLDAVEDPDETIRSNARAALNDLRDESTRDALCLRVIETNDSLARAIALDNSYAPREAEMRALFYFLTEQWQAYDSLDFDQSMVRTIYEASPDRPAEGQPQLRQRIAAHVQAAGRTDYLTILAGVDYRSRSEEVTASEAALMIRVLAENREYHRLWSLAPELALPFSLEIIRILKENHWQPEVDADKPIFEEMVHLAQRPIQLTGLEQMRGLPLAIPRATVKVKGRINDIAFSPTQPVLAIATSQRKVVLWNFQTAAIERIIDSFKHSVGKVSYTKDGWLVCAERTTTQSFCTVSVFNEEETFQLCAHTGTVTVLEPFGANYLLTAGRDQHAFVWDLDLKKKIAQKEYPFWARSAAVSPDRQYAALLHDRLAIVRLPDLSVVPGYPFLTTRTDDFKPGVAQNAAFSPDGRFILAGQHNGQVGLYFHTSLTQSPRKAVVTQHSQPVRGISFLPDHPLVITAGAEGQVRFIRWPEMKLHGMVYAPEGQLTSLRISKQGAFMATGTNEASLVLWDLRVLDIPDLFTQPLATASHDQVSTVMALSEYHTLPEPVRNGLRFLRLLLQYRFRFDIHIEEAPMIQFGEFDILLEEK